MLLHVLGSCVLKVTNDAHRNLSCSVVLEGVEDADLAVLSRWYFALISMSGVFAVTFSIVFAYVADVTDESERSSAYGLVSATFAASLVTSPALGAYLGKVRH